MAAQVPAAPNLAAPEPASWTRLFALDMLDNRYPSLHGLRFFAIVTVVQFHVTSVLIDKKIVVPGWLAQASINVFFGMDLFFVLSGFLIGSILIHSMQGAGVRGIGRFYLRRIFRTFPSYWLVLTIVSLIGPLSHMQRQNLILEYTYLTNFAPLWPGEIVMVWGWSLALEEQFYLSVPALFMLLYRLKSDLGRVSVLLVLAATALLLRLFVYLYWGPWSYLLYRGAVYFRTPTRIDTLVAGILLAYVHHRWKNELDRWMAVPLHRGLVALGVLACLWPLLEPAMFGPQYYVVIHVLLWGTVTSAMYFGLVLLLLHGPSGAVTDFLSRPIFRKLATLGYGVYLVHIPVCERIVVPLADLMRARGVPAGGVWTASLVALMLASTAVAYVLHLLVEKPSLWVRSRVAA